MGSGHDYTDDDIWFDFYEGLFTRCKKRNGNDPQRSANMVLLETLNDRYYNAGYQAGFRFGLRMAKLTAENQDKLKEVTED